MANSEQIHTNTKFRTINLADMKFEFQPTEPMLSFEASLSDGTVLQSNFCKDYHKFKNNPGFRYFLIDNKDHDNMQKVWSTCKTQREKERMTEEYLGNVTKIAKNFPNKRIYVRLIPPVTVGGDGEQRVFAVEVMEILPIVLRQQGIPIGIDDVRLMSRIHQSIEVPFPGAYRTFTISEFETILNEFDIDKSLITLVPDPSHEMTRRNYINRGGYIRLFAPDMLMVTDMYQAANHIFSQVVMGKNWSNEDCQKHKKCNENMKQQIMDCFEMLKGGSELWLDCAKQYQFVQGVRGYCEFTHHRFPDYFMDRSTAESQTDIDNYNSVVDHFGIPKYPVFPPASSKDKCLPVWMHRMLCKLGWIQQFFVEGDNLDAKKMLIECLYFMVPEQHVGAAREFVTKVLDGSIVALKNEPSSDAGDDIAVKMLTAQMRRNAIIQRKKESAKNKKKDHEHRQTLRSHQMSSHQSGRYEDRRFSYAELSVSMVDALVEKTKKVTVQDTNIKIHKDGKKK